MTALLLVPLCVGALAGVGVFAVAVGLQHLVWLWFLYPLVVSAIGIAGAWITGTGGRCGVALAILGGTAGFLLGFGIDNSVLSFRGVPVTASVSDVSSYVDRGQTTYEFTLVEPDGAVVPGGTLEETADPNQAQPYRVGNRVTVVFDPDGVVAPELPQDVHPASSQFIAAGVLVVVLLGCFVWWGLISQFKPRKVRPARR